MNRIRLLRNPIREYAWGSRTALAEILGEPAPAPRPQAELWLGAHATAPSEVAADSGWVPLDAWIRRDPEGVLGRRVAQEFAGELPFLLKVLAAEQPLSLQAHPDAARARAGFERENAAGIALGAPERNYRDANPKPELVCALSPFTALCGFRPIGELIAHIDELRAHGLARSLGALRSERTSETLRGFYSTLMTQPRDATAAVVDEAVLACESGYGDPEVRGWIRKLAALHPGDVGVLSPLFLNLVELQAGEALFLGAGELHAYLHGTAVEIMANSDNVLRGGLTPKHVDVAELLATLHFRTGPPQVRTPGAAGPLESVYATPAREFLLSVLKLAAGDEFASGARDTVELVWCADGAAQLAAVAGHDELRLPRGGAALIPAAAGAYRVRGAATLFRASVPRRPVTGAFDSGKTA